MLLKDLRSRLFSPHISCVDFFFNFSSEIFVCTHLFHLCVISAVNLDARFVPLFCQRNYIVVAVERDFQRKVRFTALLTGAT